MGKEGVIPACNHCEGQKGDLGERLVTRNV